ncbi:MAG: efflux RND transporter periplasmic adaptor subunit [Bacteroidales bacterium]|nr:efflux RND transporter periplasmic adaptor subunit [Bacteroidales bacterium]
MNIINNFRKLLNKYTILIIKFPSSTRILAASVLGVFFILVSCTSEEKSPEVIKTKTDETLLTLTKKQFESSQMELGSLLDTVFHSLVKTSGFVDVPEQNKMQIGSYYGGRVSDIYIVTGQNVVKGQLLLSFDNPEFIDMQREFIETGVLVNNLKAVLDRQQKLAYEKVSSQKDLQQAETEFMIASAKLKSLREKLKLMQIDIENLNVNNISSLVSVKAPFSGSIASILVSKGQWLNPDEQAIEIVNTSTLLARMDVFEKDLSYLRTGQPVYLQLPDRTDLNFRGNISYIAQQVNKDKRSAGVIVSINTENKGILVPGMFLTGNIAVDDSKVSVLPEDAVIEIDGRYFVLMFLNETETDFIFKRIKVLPVRSMFGLTELTKTSGIKSGALFLTKGAFQLIQAEE